MEQVLYALMRDYGVSQQEAAELINEGNGAGEAE